MRFSNSIIHKGRSYVEANSKHRPTFAGVTHPILFLVWSCWSFSPGNMLRSESCTIKSHRYQIFMISSTFRSNSSQWRFSSLPKLRLQSTYSQAFYFSPTLADFAHHSLLNPQLDAWIFPPCPLWFQLLVFWISSLLSADVFFFPWLDLWYLIWDFLRFRVLKTPIRVDLSPWKIFFN